MMDQIFGFDFGTTNSLISIIQEDKARGNIQVVSYLTDEEDPHPSMVILKGDEILLGASAKDQANQNLDGVIGDVIKSPKIYLGGLDNQYPIPGRKDFHRIDLVSHVISHVIEHATEIRRKEVGGIKKAIFTIPVTFDGSARKELREAARKAGIDVYYFVHEPLAALYGYFREENQKENSKNSIDAYDGSFVLVFDWGGGTLDLTLCQIRGGVLHQIKNSGNSEIGGDEFDENVRGYIESEHAKQYGISGLRLRYNAGVDVKLRNMCESAKRRLSTTETQRIFLQKFLTPQSGSETNDGSTQLNVTLTREKLEEICKPRINEGIEMIDRLLKDVRLDYSSIAMCLPTGGMVNMPAIRTQLEQLFPGRVVEPDYGDRIISQGAAWIGHDRALPVFSKPLEVMDASGSPNTIAEANEPLPINGENRELVSSNYYSTNPSEGKVTFQFQRPVYVGRYSAESPRKTYGSINLEIHQEAKPMLEALKLSVNIDENYIVDIRAWSTMRKKENGFKISDLEFALRVPDANHSVIDASEWVEENSDLDIRVEENNYPVFRSLVTDKSGRQGAQYIPGHLIDRFFALFDLARPEPTQKQEEERLYYVPCSICKETLLDCSCPN
ncbi:Hsp70 family protein [Rhodospirillaceae bacterium]|nr:Hsp70 family protein [Rhodospirillaceae bacterium]